MLPKLSQDEVFRYARHLTIPEVGIEGQRKLKTAHVLVVGTGGLGSPISLYLAGAGVGHIGLVDFDVVTSSNLQRQVIHDTQHLGLPKVESARDRILALNPSISLKLYNEPFSIKSAERIISGYDMVLDGTDNLATRYLINDVCVLNDIPYIYGSVYQFEGQVSVFDAAKGPCYRCIFKEPPPSESMPSGVQLGVFGALPGTIGTIQVAEAIKLIIKAGKSLIGYLLLYDALNMEFHKLEIKKDPTCKVCGGTPVIRTLDDQPQYYVRAKPVVLADAYYIEPEVLKERLESGESIQLIDVRLPVEHKISSIRMARLIPLSQLSMRLSELDNQRPIVLFSRENALAINAFQTLHESGFRDVQVLRGGINAWAKNIDPSIYQY